MKNEPSQSEENALSDYGADIVSELFGEPQEPPNTLLWIANMLYQKLAHLASYMQREETPNTAQSRARPF